MIGPQEHPWHLARRLGKELSDVLAKCDGGQWYALIAPSTYKASFATAAMPDPEERETPSARVNRLGWELAQALDEYADGQFSAYVIPAKRGGACLMLTEKMEAPERRIS